MRAARLLLRSAAGLLALAGRAEAQAQPAPCDRSADTVLTTRLWRLVRADLERAQATEQDPRARLSVSTWVRQLDSQQRGPAPDGTPPRWVGGPPYRSAHPDTLARRGWVVPAGNGTFTFHGPGVAALLSTAFARDHCIMANRREGARVGLAFAPRTRQSLPDIAGTFWVDTAVSRLTTMEFRYVNLPKPVEAPGVGGELHFEPTYWGTAVVSRWHLRTAVFGATPSTFQGGSRNVVTGYVEDGGSADAVHLDRTDVKPRVVAAGAPAGAPATAAAPAPATSPPVRDASPVANTVESRTARNSVPPYTSVGGVPLVVPAGAVRPASVIAGQVLATPGDRPISAATVTIRGATVADLTTDSLGRFAVPEATPGDVTVDVALPVEVSRKRSRAPVPVAITPGDTTRLTIRVPLSHSPPPSPGPVRQLR